jgi:hypothetical protein
MKITADKIIRWAIRGSIVLLIYHLAYILISLQRIPPIVPLFNQMPWGEARLAPKFAIFIPFGISFGIFIMNIIIASVLYTKMPLIARIVSITSLLVCMLGAVFIFRTLQLLI